MVNPFRHALIGIHITSNAVYLVQVSICFNRYSIKHFASERLPPYTIVNNQIKNVLVVSNCIKRLLPNDFLLNKKVSLSIPDELIHYDTIQVDRNRTEDEIESVALLRASKQWDLPVTEINVDFNRLESRLNTSSVLDVFIISAPLKAVNQRLEVAQLAGLRVRCIEPESVSITRFIAYYPDVPFSKSKSEVVGVVNTIFSVVTVYYLNNQNVIFSQEERIENFYEGYQDREKYKEIIKSSLEAFHNIHPKVQVKNFFLIGDCVESVVLLETLKKSLSVNVKRVNWFEKIKVSKKLSSSFVFNSSAFSTVACSLALKSSKLC